MLIAECNQLDVKVKIQDKKCNNLQTNTYKTQIVFALMSMHMQECQLLKLLC